jgi:hypothetical protein
MVRIVSGALNELLRVCIQIDRLQGHCKSPEDRERLQEFYYQRKRILSGGWLI